MSAQEDEPLPPELGLPIEHLFMVDPLDLTSEDLLLIAQHYRAGRVNFQKLEAKPKTVEKSRGPKLTPEQTKAAADAILGKIAGLSLKPKAVAKPEPEPEEEVEEEDDVGADDD